MSNLKEIILDVLNEIEKKDTNLTVTSPRGGGPSKAYPNKTVGVLKMLSARENGMAYEINLERIKNQREGSVVLDMLNFRKNVHITGWKISVLILMVDDTVEYVLYSGEKNIDRTEKEKNPLGPFQGFDGGDIIGAASELK